MFLLILLFLPLTTGMKVLHLADFHLDVEYSTTGEPTESGKCHNVPGGPSRKLGVYGDYMCDSPLSLVDFSVQEARRIIPNPDVILWTGDNVPHIDNYTMDYVINALNITTSAILSQFPAAPFILPTFGNHDYAPSGAFPSNSSLYAKTWELWKNWIPNDQQKNFLLGGYYKYVFPNATFLVLNTNLYYDMNTAYDQFTNKSDPAQMFEFMTNELQAAENCKNKVLLGNCNPLVHIVAHIPPGVFEKTPNFTWFRPEYNKKYLEITARYKDSIGWMFYGHHHSDTFHLVKDNSSKTVQVSFMAPAITPWFSSLAGAGANNPGFRIYEIEDTISYRIRDIKTYSVNLTELNNNPGNASFQFEYSFRDDYGMTSGVDAAAMDILLQRMKTNDSVFQQYINYNTMGWNEILPVNEFRGAQLCSIEWSDYDHYYSCMAGYYPKSAMGYVNNLFFVLFSLFIIH